MNAFSELVSWFGDPANWSGSGGIPARLFEHVQLSAVSVAAASLVALPVGVAIGHARRLEPIVVGAANVGRAIPSLAILAVTFPIAIEAGLGFTFWPTFVALFLLALPPILMNAYVGVTEVDPDTVEAARGTGMSEGQVLWKVEVPLAAPLIVAGVRTSAVQVVATATLAAVIAWGGLGRFIVDGFKQQNDAMLLGGAVLVAGLAVVTELLLGALERLVTPASLRFRSVPAAGPGRAPEGSPTVPR